MTAGQKLFELNGKMEEVLSDAAAVQAKIDAGDNHLVVKTIAVLLAFVGMITSFSFALERGPYAAYWAALGTAVLIVNVVIIGKVLVAPTKYSIINREMSERFETAQTEYLRVLEDEAEAYGIDAGTVDSRQRENEENTSFIAHRNGLPVNLTVEKQGNTMVIKENGRLLSEMQPA